MRRSHGLESGCGNFNVVTWTLVRFIPIHLVPLTPHGDATGCQEATMILRPVESPVGTLHGHRLLQSLTAWSSETVHNARLSKWDIHSPTQNLTATSSYCSDHDRNDLDDHRP